MNDCGNCIHFDICTSMSAIPLDARLRRRYFFPCCMYSPKEVIMDKNEGSPDRKLDVLESRVRAAYAAATYDETRETLKRMWPEVLKSKDLLEVGDIVVRTGGDHVGEYAKIIGVDSSNVPYYIRYKDMFDRYSKHENVKLVWRD